MPTVQKGEQIGQSIKYNQIIPSIPTDIYLQKIIQNRSHSKSSYTSYGGLYVMTKVTLI